MSSERVVQAAIYAALTGSAPFMALVSGVYDGVAPAGTAYPYTLLGAMTENVDHAHDADGWDHTITIHDWSADEGRKRLQQIREARNAVLHRAQLTVAGYGLTRMTYEFGETLPEWDDDLKLHLRHQVTRYRVRSITTA